MAAIPKTSPPRVARIMALQPRMDLSSLTEPVMATQDPAILGVMTNLVRVWAWGNKLVPADFAEHAVVTAVSRQPVVYASVDLERCGRSREQSLLPLPPGRAINSKPWPTEDLFELVPIGPPVFNATATTDRRDLPGCQSAERCGRCQGSGASRCGNCTGGRVVCPACDGALRTACPRCGGAGTHLGVSGRVIQCRNCSSRGTIECTRCGKQGMITCIVCGGEGKMECGPCGGHGNVLRVWELTETRQTDHRHHHFTAESWRHDWSGLFDRTDVIDERIYQTTADPPAIALDSFAPPRAHALAVDVLKDALATHAGERRSGEATDRIVAARVRLCGMYAYDVSLQYLGQTYGLLVSAGGTSVVPRRLPAARRGPLSWVGRIIRRYLRALQTDEVAGPQKAFILAVRSGHAHIGDERCLIPAAAAAVNARFDVTADGYRVHVRDQPRGDVALSVPLDVRFDLDQGDQRVVCIDVDLGEARRDRYVAMLALCHELSIGRLAVVDGPNGTERVCLVDRRPYETSEPGQYAGVLKLMAAAARRLRGDDALS